MSTSTAQVRVPTVSQNDRRAVLAHLAARILWGGATIYFSMTLASDSLRIFEQRVLWAFAFITGICIARGELPILMKIIRDCRAMLITILASVIIATNWFVVIWCATNGDLISAGLGFFLAPLLMIMAGAVVLKEKITPHVALSLIVCGAGIMVYFNGSLSFPWPVIYVSISTTAYTLIRKIYTLPALIANSLESGIALIFSTVIVIYLQGPAAILPPSEDYWLYYPGLGLITALPMLLFVFSLPKVSILVISYLQYVTPTIVMAAGLLMGEAVRTTQVLGLGLIWLAVFVSLLGSQLKPASMGIR